MQENVDKITPELCKKKDLVFYPKTVAEVVFIQRQLFAMGFQWFNAHAPHKIQWIDECLSEGMHLNGGKLSWDVYETKKSLLCQATQFEEVFDESDPKNLHVPADQSFLLQLFNTLSARIDGLAEEVDIMREALQPRGLEKPAVSIRKPPAPRRMNERK